MADKTHITGFEIFDDVEEHVVTIKAFDEACATVEFMNGGGLTNAQAWPELSAAILAALEAMDPTSDKPSGLAKD